MSATLFDSHCHLEDERFANDTLITITNMQLHNVKRCILAGSDLETSEKIARMTERWVGVLYGVVGVHPHEAKFFDEKTLPALEALLKRRGIVGIGEIGLDYHYDLSPRETQRAVLEKQLDFAYEKKVPAVFHVREAHGDMLELFRSRRGRLPAGVLHCYTGSAESAREYLDMGFYISFSGSVTFKSARRLQEAALVVPADRLLVETDSPYLAPEPVRGTRNEPANVRYVAQKLAELRGVPLEELTAQTTANVERLYHIASLPET